MSNTLLIYNQLRAAGVSRAGALGLMGNWKAESGLEPGRLQNDFSANRIYSHAYTADVTAGRITRTQFAHRPGEKAGTLRLLEEVRKSSGRCLHAGLLCPA